MPTIDGAAAARTLLGYAPLSKHGYCLYYVWLAMKAHGATSGTTYPTAYSAWQATTKRHGDKNPPAGAAVWLGRRGSDGYLAGDVCISVGGGKVACTDYPSWGQVGTCTIDQRIAQTGRAYLGWSEDFLGNTTVIVGAGAGGAIAGSDVSFVQSALNLLAGANLAVDGELGQFTKAAVVTFQSAHGLTADGIPGPITQAALVQALLNRTGARLAVDGDIGPATRAAIESFQRATGLVVDGIAGPNTKAKLLAWQPSTTTPPPAVPGRNATSRPLTEIQGFLKVAQSNVWDQATSDAVLAFQTAQAIDADRIWGPTSDGLAFPPAGSIHLVDYSFDRPGVALLVGRGVKGAGRYLWSPNYADGRTNKGISPAELAELNGQGLDVFFIYEEDGKELLGGRDAGVRVATAAEGFLTALGKAGHPIYFNVDYDAPAADLPKILDALDGIASVIGLERTGLYAGLGPIKAAFDAGKIRWGFQTYAWSGGVWDARAQLQQWSNGQWGGSVDFTRAMVAEYGQNPVDTTTPSEGVTLTQAQADRLTAILDEARGIIGGGE